ncbi:MAG TPA: hypothetical protein VF746_26855 [Longimicrobium sp.]|jgi:hypothetical protein
MSSIRRILPLLALLAPAGPLAGAAAQADSAAARAPAAVLAGRVIPADDGDPRGLRVFARAGAFADSAGVDSLGRFAVPLPAELAGDTVELAVDAADPAARAFHPAVVRLGRYQVEAEHEIVLLPLRWKVRGGRYAGQEVEVRLARAFERACERCSSFYRRATERAAEPGRTSLQAWPEERFPLRVAFDREWSGERVSARDSAAFWRHAEELEEVFGADVFRPAVYGDALPGDDGGPHDVILVWIDPEMHRESGLGSAIAFGGEIEYGDLRLGRGSLSSPDAAEGLVPHELMHTLGFGHTCAWRSVLADVRRCPGQRAPTATAEDVAYVQLAARLRALQRERRARWVIEAALAGAPLLRDRAPGLVLR